MRTLLAAVVGFVFLVGTQADDKFEADKLNGTWKVTAGKKAGTDISEDAKKTVVAITKDKLTMTMNTAMGEMKFDFKYTIDAKATPVSIDLEITDGPIGKGEKRKGILVLKDDELKLAYAVEAGDDRPTKIDDAKAHCFTLKREKVEKKNEKKEEKKLEQGKVENKAIIK